MRTLMLSCFLFLAAGLFFSCRNSNSSGQETAEKALQKENTALVDSYMKLKDALFNGKTDDVKVKAGDMQAEIDKAHLIQPDAAMEQSWKQDAAKLKDELGRIQNAASIDEQRKVFADFTEDMYNSLKKYDLYGKTVYYDHCPMAFENKGANWLSDNEEIKNPYFGEEMPNCGEVITDKTLKTK